MTRSVRTRATDDLERLGAANGPDQLGATDRESPALTGIDAHFRAALWELLGAHVRDPATAGSGPDFGTTLRPCVAVYFTV